MLKHFCIIEDSEADCLLLRQAIAEGYPDANVVCVETLEDAKKLAEEKEVDVFVLDFYLNGVDASSFVRPESMQDSIVILTSGLPVDYLKTFDLPVDGYSKKPLTAHKIEQIMRGAKWLHKTSA